MLVIPVKDGENIDRALKRFKRKFDRKPKHDHGAQSQNSGIAE